MAKMNWLITLRADADLEHLEERIRDLGGELDRTHPPVPLDQEQATVHCQGPVNLRELLKSTPGVIDVYPDSDMELY